MYLPRHAEKIVKKISAMFGAVLVSGPRQVGKSKMIEQVLSELSSVRRVTFDDQLSLLSALEQSDTFLKDHPPPLFIDEVQRAPKLFYHIKQILDKDKKKGQFYLSSSQQFDLMEGVSESLSGRIGLVNLLPLSLREQNMISYDAPFLPNNRYFEERGKEIKPVDYEVLWKTIQRGSLPKMVVEEDFDWQYYYGSYVRTYIDRDVKIADEMKFTRFMMAAAGHTGQLLNMAAMARDVGVSQPTAERWLSILVSSNIIYLLEPYHNNLISRAIKTPKLYFLDTGLAAYLTRWTNPEALRAGAMGGAFFESFVISEILKSYYNAGIMKPPLYFYRDREGNEIDLLIEDSGTIHPLEIKKHANPSKKDITTFKILDSIPTIKRGSGGVICVYESLVALEGKDRVIPVSYL